MQKRDSSRQSGVLVLLGVLFTIILAGLDNTIVSTVIPVALPELGGGHRMDDIEFHIDHPSARDSSCLFIAHLSAVHTASPVPVISENVISRLRSRVAREPALGVVSLRRRAG